jgi:hypothetical protein
MYSAASPFRKVSRQWKYALFGGLLALPFTALSYWQTGSELSLTPVLVGGALAGYLAKRRIGDSRGVGIRAGLVGSLPVIWILFDILRASSALAGPSWFVAGATILTVGFTVGVAILGFGLAAVIGELGARVGSWVAGKRPGQPTPAVDL